MKLVIVHGIAFALGWSFEARMGMPRRQNIAEILCPLDNELLLAPSSPLVQPARVEATRDAPLLTVST